MKEDISELIIECVFVFGTEKVREHRTILNCVKIMIPDWFVIILNYIK